MGIPVLSIDWDFFFPDTLDFDWSHNERMGFLFDSVWSIRANNYHLRTKERAIDVMHPDPELLNGFWGMLKASPFCICIAESHQAIYEWLENLHNDWAFDSDVKPTFDVVNFDAHHDFFYHDREEELHCGNWAGKSMQKGIIENYRVIYPPWREGNEEQIVIPEGLSCQVDLWPQSEIPRFYTLLFICRSSCWTPPWADDAWMDFIGHWEKNKELWERKAYNDFAIKPRNLTMDKAIEAAAEYDELFERAKQEIQTSKG